MTHAPEASPTRSAEQGSEAKPLVQPPDLNQQSDRSATRLELFVDLAFVLVVAQCADLLAAEETWVGVAEFAGLLTLAGWSWASLTLHANRFDTDDLVFRLYTLVAMAGVVGLAASVSEVEGHTGRWFAASSVLLRLVLVAQYARAWRHVPAARGSIRPYLVAHALAGLLWAVSIGLTPPGRYVLWGAATLVEVLAPLWASRAGGRAPLHLEHLPERYALLIILVLGESVAGMVSGLQEGAWRPVVVLAAALGFLVAAALWWAYFDLTGGVAKLRLLREGGTSRMGVHDFYLYAHLPIAVGIGMVAVGIEHAIVHAGDAELAASTRGVLVGGVVLYLLGSLAVQVGMARDVRAALPWPGLVVPATLPVAFLPLSPPVVLAVLAVLLCVGLAGGLARRRSGELATVEV